MRIVQEPPGSSSNRPSDQDWLQGCSVAEIQSKQEAEPNLKQVLLWKKNQASQPALQEVQGASKATESFWAQWNRLQLKNGVLYCQWGTEDGHGTCYN